MRLTLACHPITEIRLETPTHLDGTVLVIDPEELSRLVLEDDSLTGVDFEIIRPGERCRGAPVFDAPSGPHRWLAETLFVCSLAPMGRRIRIDVYAVA